MKRVRSNTFQQAPPTSLKVLKVSSWEELWVSLVFQRDGLNRKISQKRFADLIATLRQHKLANFICLFIWQQWKSCQAGRWFVPLVLLSWGSNQQPTSLKVDMAVMSVLLWAARVTLSTTRWTDNGVFYKRLRELCCLKKWFRRSFLAGTGAI